MMRMMTVEEFVMLENPFQEREDEEKALHEILDSIYLDPLERELIRKNLVKKTTKTVLSYRPDLVINYIEYYRENTHIPFQVEVLGVDNNIVDKIAEGLKGVMHDYDFMAYSPALQGVFATGIFGMQHTELEILNENITQFAEDYTIRMMGRKDARLMLEYIGVKYDATDTYILCVIYDRWRNMHGYVVLKV